MPLDVTLTDKEMSVDPIATLFRVSALMSDHVTRQRQAHVNHSIDLGQGVKGRVVGVDYKNITVKADSGERRTVPMTPKRAALLANPPDSQRTTTPASSAPSAPSASSAPSSSNNAAKRTSHGSPRKANAHTAAATTRK